MTRTKFLVLTDDGLPAESSVDTTSLSVIVQNFTLTTHYNAGDTQLTLSSAPATEDSVDVSFDGVNQHNDTFTLASNVITFSQPIPTGVDAIQVRWGPLAGGAPGSVWLHATNSVVQSSLTATTPVQFATEVADSHNAFASGVFTVPVAGVYTIATAVESSSTNARFLVLRVNSATVAKGSPVNIAGCATLAISRYCAQGDTLAVALSGETACTDDPVGCWLTIRGPTA